MNVKYWFCFFLLWMFAFPSMAANKKFTLVIDPGHGGKDQGAVGAYTKEKDLTLKFGLAFGQLVERNCPDVKVIYTRKTDVFIPLNTRAEIANRNKSDLFVSIHINALPNGRIASGVQTYTLGRSEVSGKKGIMENLEVAKRENAVILLEDNYQQTYQGYDPNSPESNIMFEFIQDKNMLQSVELAKMMQRSICSSTGLPDMGAHQNNLAVLRLSSMPGCLLELGFISTPQDEAFMNTDDAENKYAQGILNAFMQYKDRYFKGLVVPYKTAPKVAPQMPAIVPEKYQQEAASRTEDISSSKTQQGKDKQQSQPSQQEEKLSKLAENLPSEGHAAETMQKNQSESIVAKAPVTTQVVPDAPNLSAANVPVFKIQIFSVSRKIDLNDKVLKGLKGCEFFEDDGIFKYTYGASTNYNDIKKVRQQITDLFPDAFIIAFKDGQKMDITKGIREFLQNKKNK